MTTANNQPRTNGLLPSDSILCRMSCEAVLLLGGGRAILLQLAHPLIAAGVAEHSQFRNAPLVRLQHTLEMMNGLLLGHTQEAMTALQNYHRVHAPVHGTLSERVGHMDAGTAYSAHDPALRLWVWATQVDTQLVVYERFLKPCSSVEREQYYHDSKRIGRFLGIPDTILPPNFCAFQNYMNEMFASEILAVNARTLDLARATVIDPNVALVPRLCARLVRFVTVGLLSENLRTAYGFIWNRKQQSTMDRLSWFSRKLIPILPNWVRYKGDSQTNSFVNWAIQKGMPRAADSKSAPL